MEPASRRGSYKREEIDEGGYFPKAIISVSKIAWLGHWSMNEIYTHAQIALFIFFSFSYPTVLHTIFTFNIYVHISSNDFRFFSLLPLTRPQARSLLCKNSLNESPEPPVVKKRQTNKMSRHLNILDERGYSNTQSAHEKWRWNQIPWAGRWTRIKFSS